MKLWEHQRRYVENRYLWQRLLFTKVYFLLFLEHRWTTFPSVYCTEERPCGLVLLDGMCSEMICGTSKIPHEIFPCLSLLIFYRQLQPLWQNSKSCVIPLEYQILNDRIKGCLLSPNSLGQETYTPIVFNLLYILLGVEGLQQLVLLLSQISCGGRKHIILSAGNLPTSGVFSEKRGRLFHNDFLSHFLADI